MELSLQPLAAGLSGPQGLRQEAELGRDGELVLGRLLQLQTHLSSLLPLLTPADPG